MRGFVSRVAVVVCALGCGGAQETAITSPSPDGSESGGATAEQHPVADAVPANETPTEVREHGPGVDDGEAVGAWIAERVARARGGVRDYVRFPLAEQADGWGCRCPTHYVGGSPDEHDGGPTWLRVVNDSGTALPAAPSESVDDDGETYERNLGQVLLVDGYFDGEVVREDLRNDPDAPEEWVYDLSVFHVTRVHERIEPDRALDERVAILGP